MSDAPLPTFSPGAIPATYPLIIALHGTGKTEDSLEGVLDVVRAAFPGIPKENIHCPQLVTRALTRESLLAITRRAMDEIDTRWKPEQHRGVILIGHSLGGLIARKIYAAACGSCVEAPMETELGAANPRPWADKVERVILLASLDRGWRLSHEVALSQVILQMFLPLARHLSRYGFWASLPEAAMWGWLGGWVGVWAVLSLAFGFPTDVALPWRLLAGAGAAFLIRCAALRANPGRQPLTLFDVERGEPYVEKLRFQWARMRWRSRQGTGTCGRATVVRLLGSEDWLVEPEDAADPVFEAAVDAHAPSTAGPAPEKRYYAMEVPQSDHRSLIDMMPGNRSGAKEALVSRRRELLSAALTGDHLSLARLHVELIEESQVPRRDSRVTDVIFVIHGIRDRGFWTQHVAQRIRRYAADEGHKVKIIATETSSYGYFAMLPFVLSRTRQRKVLWLLDQYAENCALYPEAQFHYIGHSNGTYLAARAMLKIDAVRFTNVVFAGSVLPRDYGWRALIQGGQVKRVLNYVATADWVVGVFPWAIGWIQRGGDVLRRWLGRRPRRDLGSASHDGFDDEYREAGSGNGVWNEKWARGGHAAALEEGNWEAIARFVSGGDPGMGEDCREGRQFRTGMVICRLICLVLVAAVLWGIACVSPWHAGWLETSREWWQFAGFVGGVAALMWILRRV